MAAHLCPDDWLRRHNVVLEDLALDERASWPPQIESLAQLLSESMSTPSSVAIEPRVWDPQEPLESLVDHLDLLFLSTSASFLLYGRSHAPPLRAVILRQIAKCLGPHLSVYDRVEFALSRSDTGHTLLDLELQPTKGRAELLFVLELGGHTAYEVPPAGCRAYDDFCYLAMCPSTYRGETASDCTSDTPPASVGEILERPPDWLQVWERMDEDIHSDSGEEQSSDDQEDKTMTSSASRNESDDDDSQSGEPGECTDTDGVDDEDGDEDDDETDSRCGGSSNSDRYGSSVSSSLIELNPHWHVLSPLHARPLVPALCVADEVNLIPLMTSTLYQRRALHLSVPVVGILIPQSSTTCKILFGWVDEDPGRARVLPLVHIIAPVLDRADAGSFDVCVPEDLVQMIRFLSSLGPYVDTLRSSAQDVDPLYTESLPWRADGYVCNIKPDEALKGRIWSWLGDVSNRGKKAQAKSAARSRESTAQLTSTTDNQEAAAHKAANQKEGKASKPKARFEQTDNTADIKLEATSDNGKKEGKKSDNNDSAKGSQVSQNMDQKSVVSQSGSQFAGLKPTQDKPLTEIPSKATIKDWEFDHGVLIYPYAASTSSQQVKDLYNLFGEGAVDVLTPSFMISLYKNVDQETMSKLRTLLANIAPNMNIWQESAGNGALQVLDAQAEPAGTDVMERIPHAHALLADYASLVMMLYVHSFVKWADERKLSNEAEWRQPWDMVFHVCQRKLLRHYDPETYNATQFLHINYLQHKVYCEKEQERFLQTEPPQQRPDGVVLKQLTASWATIVKKARDAADAINEQASPVMYPGRDLKSQLENLRVRMSRYPKTGRCDAAFTVVIPPQDFYDRITSIAEGSGRKTLAKEFIRQFSAIAPPSKSHTALALDDAEETGVAAAVLQFLPSAFSLGCPSLEHALQLPYLVIDYKLNDAKSMEVAANQRRMNSVSVARFLRAIGITDFAVYGVAHAGQYFTVSTTWYSSEDKVYYTCDEAVPRFNFKLFRDVVRFAAFILQLEDHARALRERYDSVKEAFFKRVKDEFNHCGRGTKGLPLTSELWWTASKQADLYGIHRPYGKKVPKEAVPAEQPKSGQQSDLEEQLPEADLQVHDPGSGSKIPDS
ncbi:hypothetical protein C8T65DRAFT_729860 [Cerioporus squamosus]|nr:hypothetical protein C8T65DRAFT_729860 [Cerioporus squamosus]